MRDNLAQQLMWVIWPAFLVAGCAEAIFFTLFDPFDLHLFGNPPTISRQTFYSLGFFGFWGLGIASSALTVFLRHSPFEGDDLQLEPKDIASTRTATDDSGRKRTDLG